MSTSHIEVERKYDVGDTEQVPDLSGLPGAAALVGGAEEQLLTATYFDTAELRLRAAGITLRHRSGGTDAGWHLKLPAGADREEVHADGGDPAGGVPAALTALVRSRIRQAPLAPVAKLTTRRTVHRLLDDSGAMLVEVADDRVTGEPSGSAAPALQWREWEAELGTGDRHLLDEVQGVLLAAGATLSGSGSKVGRVLGRLPVPDGQPAWWAERAVTSRKVTAGGVLQAHLAEQVEELTARDPHARRDVADAVHKMRVATRRLRSALSTFGPLLDRNRTDPLRDELRWLAGALGGPRDAEVMHARLKGLVAAQDPDLVLGPVQARIDTVLGARHRAAHDALLAELDSGRYLGLLDDLDALVAEPPLLEAARGRATDVLPRLVKRAERRLSRALREAAHTAPGEPQDLLLHEARKDAKRARYVSEAVTPVFGRAARRWASAVADLQQVLGEHQDGVVTRDALREIGVQAHLAGEDTFTYGRLHGLEQGRAEAAAAHWPQARKAVRDDKLSGWFS